MSTISAVSVSEASGRISIASSISVGAGGNCFDKYFGSIDQASPSAITVARDKQQPKCKRSQHV